MFLLPQVALHTGIVPQQSVSLGLTPRRFPRSEAMRMAAEGVHDGTWLRPTAKVWLDHSDYKIAQSLGNLGVPSSWGNTLSRGMLDVVIRRRFAFER